jgi:hypothetical protein
MPVRAPQRTYQLAGVAGRTSKPAARTDLAGSFSFINEAQFVALLKNIGQNAPVTLPACAEVHGPKSRHDRMAADQVEDQRSPSTRARQPERRRRDVGWYMQDEERARNWRVTLRPSDRIVVGQHHAQYEPR